MEKQPPIPVELWEQIPAAAQAALLAAFAAVQARVAELEARVADLERRLGQNSSNSSIPPSANPLSAPAPVKKAPTGRKRGAQPGHKGHHRERLPASRVDHVIPLIPSRCENCHAALPQLPGEHDPEPTWHQVAELPRASAVVTEFQGHARTCPCCAHVTREAIPEEITRDCFGPRLAGAVGYLAATQQVTVRGARAVFGSLFGVPVCAGAVAGLRREVSEALAEPHRRAAEAAGAAAVKNADETTWKVAGKKCWLWVAVTAVATFFLIRPKRDADALKDLLGQAPSGVLVTDRAKAYSLMPAGRRQFCWAHLKRDFQAMVDRGGEAARVGRRLLDRTKALFDNWWQFRDKKIDRETLRKRLGVTRLGVKLALESGRDGACAATAGTCRELLAAEASLWVFLEHEGVEPTNNAAERAIRTGVIWRKRSFGSNTEGGLRFVERILTVTATLRQHGGDVLEFLREAVSAHRHQLPAPCLPTSP